MRRPTGSRLPESLRAVGAGHSCLDAVTTTYGAAARAVRQRCRTPVSGDAGLYHARTFLPKTAERGPEAALGKTAAASGRESAQRCLREGQEEAARPGSGATRECPWPSGGTSSNTQRANSLQPSTESSEPPQLPPDGGATGAVAMVRIKAAHIANCNPTPHATVYLEDVATQRAILLNCLPDTGATRSVISLDIAQRFNLFDPLADILKQNLEDRGINAFARTF
jgi:hypothetical protein